MTCGDFRYSVYGVRVLSDVALSLPEESYGGFFEIRLRAAAPAYFAEKVRGVTLQRRHDWYHYAHLNDRSTYVRWKGVGEFLVFSDGKRIDWACTPETHMESLQVYLLGQALSFALVYGGLEPLHATAIAVDGGAIALLGNSGFGKSSLAASFLSAGHPLLTDDLLLLQRKGNVIEAYPGPPRIKLFPPMAKRFLGHAHAGVPMNPDTPKLVVPLDLHQSCRSPIPLRAIYTIVPPHKSRHGLPIKIEPLSMREAFLDLVSNTFNRVIVGPDRLRRQLAKTAEIVSLMPVKRLSYPRRVRSLPAVREAILSDVDRPHRITGGSEVI